METSDRRFYEHPTAEGFRGRFEDGFFGTNVGEPEPKGRAPSTLRICSSQGLVTELHYQLWNPADALVDALVEEVSARLGAPRKRQDKPRTVVWTAHGVEARLVARIEDPGLRLSLTIVGKPTNEKNKEEEPLDAVRIQFEQTFDELDRTEVRRTEDGALEFGGDIRGSEDGVLVKWEGPALVRGVLHAELIDQVLAEIRAARESADDADL